MTQAEKIEALEDMFEVDSEVITPETSMDELPWDSMAMLSLIALVNEKFGKKISASQLKDLTTVKDIIDLMI